MEPSNNRLAALPDLCATTLASQLSQYALAALIKTSREAVPVYRPFIGRIDIITAAAVQGWDEARVGTALAAVLGKLPAVHIVRIKHNAPEAIGIILLRVGLRIVLNERGHLVKAPLHWPL